MSVKAVVSVLPRRSSPSARPDRAINAALSVAANARVMVRRIDRLESSISCIVKLNRVSAIARTVGPTNGVASTTFSTTGRPARIFRSSHSATKTAAMVPNTTARNRSAPSSPISPRPSASVCSGRPATCTGGSWPRT